MNILISGYKGFLGSVLWNKLSIEHNLIGVAREQEIDNKESYSINQISTIKETPDIVIMCHASVASGKDKVDTTKLFNSNVHTTKQLVQQFPNSYLIYISSISIYGDSQDLLTEQSAPCPQTEYAISKLWGEKCVSQTENSAILRLTSLYGAGMKENTIIPNYVNQALSIGEIEVWGKGKRKQNYIHVEDVVRYIEHLISTQGKGIFIASGESEVSNIELANLISEEIGAVINFKGNDNSPSIRIDNQITRNSLSIKNKRDIKEGIKEYIQWKKKQF